MTDFGRRAGLGDMTKAVYDADEDGVVDAAPAHKTSHEDGGSDEIDLTGLVGAGGGLQCRENPTPPDWTNSDLVCDGSNHTLDCSPIVPAGKTLVWIRFNGLCATTGKRVQFKKPAHAAYDQACTIFTANMDVAINAFCFMDNNRHIDYMVDSDPFFLFTLVILGWS